MLRRIGRDLVTFDRTQIQPGAALACVPAIVALLAAGLETGHLRWALVAGAGAFSVGLGSFQEVHRSRTLPMLAATVGMCASSWIGTLAGMSKVATVVVAGLAGILYAAAWARGPGPSWVALQCVVWLVISMAFPAAGLRALTRGGLAAAGGLAQTASIWLGRRLGVPIPPIRGPGARPAPARRTVALHVARVAGGMAGAALLWRGLAIPNGYWIPMTAAIVMKPEFDDTLARGSVRLVGTLLGAAVATAIAAGLRPQPAVLAFLVAAFACGCYLFVSVNYAVFVVCLTSYVVFLLALAGLPEAAVVAHRAVNTVIGGAIAVLIHAALLPIERAARA